MDNLFHYVIVRSSSLIFQSMSGLSYANGGVLNYCPNPVMIYNVQAS